MAPRETLYNTAEKVVARMEGGRTARTWHFEDELLRAEAAVDGCYALLTTLTPERADPSDVVRPCKGQSAVDRRRSDFNGPLVVTPVFVQDNKRVAALITVICLGPLLFCLIERQVRRAAWDAARKCMASIPATRRYDPPAAPQSHPSSPSPAASRSTFRPRPSSTTGEAR